MDRQTVSPQDSGARVTRGEPAVAVILSGVRELPDPETFRVEGCSAGLGTPVEKRENSEKAE